MSSRKQSRRNERAGQASKEEPQSLGDQSLAEWVTLGVSLLILVGVVGALVYFYVGDSAPEEPTIEVRPQLGEVREATGAFYLPVEVANRGVQTASDVTIQLTLTSFAGASETVSFTIPFLPGGGTVTTVAVFQTNPQLGTTSHVFTFSRP